jgi:hypothetical protein
MNPRTAVRVACYLAAACACAALAGACGSVGGGGGPCLNPQPLPPFCNLNPEPLPPETLPDDAGEADGEGGHDAGAD